MSLVLYEGPNFSGRSDALRDFAWGTGSHKARRGLYLSPVLKANLSGLARTVGGELHLHGIRRVGRAQRSHCAATSLIDELPQDQSLDSLSGGETVRLLLTTAIALEPLRLAIDSVLEQLDRAARPRIGHGTLVPLAKTIDVHISDNAPEDLRQYANKQVQFQRLPNSPDLSSGFAELAERAAKSSVSAPALHIDNLTFRYRTASQPVFERANFVFEPGRPYLLKAPNASGKSTLARILAGVLVPQAGAIAFAGRPHLSHHSRENTFFYAFQNPLDQIFGGSARSYLTTIARINRSRPTKLTGSLGLSIDDVLTGFGLSDFVNAEPFDLPFVVAKRLSLCAAVLSRSPWIFLDEPALGSDAAGRAGLSRIVQALCAAGLGVIIVTHGQEFDQLRNQETITIKDRGIVRGEAQ